MKKGPKILIAIIVLVVFVTGIVGIKNQFIISKDQLAANITKATQNEDGDLFLKQFDKDSQNLGFAKIGAQSVVEQWHNHASVPTAEVGKRITDGHTIAGPSVKYKFYVESKKVFGLFDSYYLAAKPTSVHFMTTDDTAKMRINITNGGKHIKATAQDFRNGLFPGKYSFHVDSPTEDGRNQSGDFYVAVAGSENRFDMVLYFIDSDSEGE
ncbi:hypothetical protein [Furfurilactobacillus rossiae]|nr:hypothetical protein [Furfurilactobacillus rossiae]QFR67467.1 hypothetical protein LR814_10295 [Furfurilactobacillus rossiae]QLE60416.1 hypothetical protein LROSRS0_0368 [Furfurilactobacillus rossiae]